MDTRDAPADGALSLVVVDDDEAIRTLVRAQASRTPQVELVAEVADGAPAVRIVAGLQPDVVLLDLLMPTPGLDVLPSLIQVAPSASVLAWSADATALAEACDRGADDALEKITPWSDVVDRMRELVSARRSGIECDPTVRAGDERGAVRLVREAIEVLDGRPFEFTAPVSGTATWPCPGCGSRRPLVGAWSMEVANRDGDPMRRSVVVCAVCAEALRVEPESASVG